MRSFVGWFGLTMVRLCRLLDVLFVLFRVRLYLRLGGLLVHYMVRQYLLLYMGSLVGLLVHYMVRVYLLRVGLLVHYRVSRGPGVCEPRRGWHAIEGPASVKIPLAQ